MKRSITGVTALAVAAVLSGCGSSNRVMGPGPAAQVRTYSVRVFGPSSSPLPAASVMIQTPDQDYVVSTDNSGVAAIVIPNSVALRSQVVVVVTHPSIMPEARTCPGGAGVTASLTIHTMAAPSNLLVRDAYLRHLGNDRYATESVEHGYYFSLGAVPSQMPVVRLFARGAQRPAQVTINGIVVAELGNPSSDGSLSVYNFRAKGAPGSYLHAGNNTLSIRTASPDPYDDIEYCALTLYYP